MSFVMENDRENHNLRKVSYDKKKTGENGKSWFIIFCLY